MFVKHFEKFMYMQHYRRTFAGLPLHKSACMLAIVLKQLYVQHRIHLLYYPKYNLGIP